MAGLGRYGRCKHFCLASDPLTPSCSMCFPTYSHWQDQKFHRKTDDNSIVYQVRIKDHIYKRLRLIIGQINWGTLDALSKSTR